MLRTYKQIAQELKRRIDSGEYGAELPLPSERALEQEFGVHRMTVRRALTVLSSDGHIHRTPGHRAFLNRGGVIRSRTFGLFAGSKGDPHARTMISEGMRGKLKSRASPFSSLAYEGSHLLDLTEERVLNEYAGIVYWPPRLPNLDLLRSIRGRIPVVVVDCPIPGFESDFVGFQDFEGGYEAARHLYELGHRKIAFLGSLVPQNPEIRCMGVDAFCRDSGIKRAWNFVEFRGSRFIPEEYVKLLLTLAKQDWPTAAVCANDETAAFLFNLLSRNGIRVPHDLALIGFGNAQHGLLDALGLTTMAQPYEQVGAEATRILEERFKGIKASEPEEVRLPMSLVVRGSCGSQ